MIIGFTGTQEGMTVSQMRELLQYLLKYKPSQFHHGDCIGADAEAHALALALPIDIIIHPPIYNNKRAFCGAARILEPKPYLIRNKDIVDASDILIATPKEANEILRSGTWATIRYARKCKKTIHIITP